MSIPITEWLHEEISQAAIRLGSQKALSAAIGVSEAQISRWLSRRVKTMKASSRKGLLPHINERPPNLAPHADEPARAWCDFPGHVLIRHPFGEVAGMNAGVAIRLMADLAVAIKEATLPQ